MFLNQKLITDQYGTWFTVVWTDDVEKVIWQTKTPPEVGKTYWGWLEKTTSGKSIKFKWDKLNTPQGDMAGPTSVSKPQGGWTESPDKQDSINRAVALNNAANVFMGHGEGADPFMIQELANKFYFWLSQTDKGNVDKILGDTDNVNLDGIEY